MLRQLEHNLPVAELQRDYQAFVNNMVTRWRPESSDNRSLAPQRAVLVARMVHEWTANISPHTPVYGFSCSPRDKLLAYVRVLLTGMATIFDMIGREEVSIITSQFVSVWPCIWTWLRTLHDLSRLPQSLHIGYESPDSHLKDRKLVINILFLTVFKIVKTPLGMLTKDTEGMADTMASLWLEEGKDESLKCGFKAAGFLKHYHADDLPAVLPQIIAKCGGSACAVLEILLGRIKKNARQIDPEWDSLRREFKFTMSQLDHIDKPGFTILRQALLSHQSLAAHMIDTMSLLLQAKTSPPGARPMSTLADFLHLPLLIIFRRFQITDYDCCSQLVETKIISVFTRLPPVVASDEDILTMINVLLREVLGGFIVYRNIFSGVKRKLLAADVVHFMEKQNQGSIGQEILALSSRVDSMKKVVEMQRRHVLDCGYPQVGCLGASAGFLLICAKVYKYRQWT